MTRELPPPDALLKARDAMPLEVVSLEDWGCRYCAQPLGGTTVDWIADYGRCRECGQKFIAEDD